MMWIFHPKGELRTTVPMSLEISGYAGVPKVVLEGVGDLDLQASGRDSLKAHFYVTLPGKYRLIMSDRQSNSSYEFFVHEQKYLDFKSEFGIFFILFILVMGGLFLWVRKIMKRKTA